MQFDGHMQVHPRTIYAMQRNPHDVRPGHLGSQQYFDVYGMPTSTASPYEGVSGTAWPMQQASAGAASYDYIQPCPGQGYSGSYYESETPTTPKGDTFHGL